MGVLNVTPDSFSDGGRYHEPEQARRRVDELLSEGADIIDIGGESSRPGAAAVSAEEQIARIEPALVHATRERKVLCSVDTTSPIVARFALRHGASIINDVSCLANDDLARAVAEADGALILMHARGHFSDAQGYSSAPDQAYGDVVADVHREWSQARDRAISAGLARESILFDPGLGFMKNAAHSLTLIRRLGELEREGAPLVVGPSRKSFLAKVSAAEPELRLGGTIAACLACADRGASILRVHDVFAVRQALLVHRAIGGKDA
jgi:dihydropteroate synthase